MYPLRKRFDSIMFEAVQSGAGRVYSNENKTPKECLISQIAARRMFLRIFVCVLPYRRSRVGVLGVLERIFCCFLETLPLNTGALVRTSFWAIYRYEDAVHYQLNALLILDRRHQAVWKKDNNSRREGREKFIQAQHAKVQAVGVLWN